MSEPPRESRTAAAIDLLSIPRFLDELRRAVRVRSGPAIADVLNATVKKIEKNPAFTQSRLLTRILAALTYQQGEFRRAEVAALDSESLAMVMTLLDLQAGGTSNREDWVRAVATAQAAQLAAQ